MRMMLPLVARLKADLLIDILPITKILSTRGECNIMVIPRTAIGVSNLKLPAYQPIQVILPGESTPVQMYAEREPEKDSRLLYRARNMLYLVKRVRPACKSHHEPQYVLRVWDESMEVD